MVLDDSIISDFCKSGNIEGVQTLLRKGRASLRDTDTQGWTSLQSIFLRTLNRNTSIFLSIAGLIEGRGNEAEVKWQRVG